MIKRLDLSVKQFAEHYLSSGTKIRVIKSSEVIFEGTLEELYHFSSHVWDYIVGMVGAANDMVCLSCRE